MTLQKNMKKKKIKIHLQSRINIDFHRNFFFSPLYDVINNRVDSLLPKGRGEREREKIFFEKKKKAELVCKNVSSNWC